MVVNSSCKRAYQLDSWNGKIFDIKIWKQGFSPLNSKESSHSFDSLKTFQKNVKFNENSNSVIIFGAHHKTGTMLAKKLFGRLCVIFKWCCVFRVTRDSVEVINNDLLKNDLNLIGHTQWIWYPEKFNVPYVFIHFYRNPFKKIISGYKYHKKGVEFWTNQIRWYNNSCHMFSIRNNQLGSSEKMSYIYEYCKSTQPCLSCCRIAHELQSLDGEVYYSFRRDHEYDLMCKYLSTIDSPLSTAFNTYDSYRGIKIQALLDYYENLRIAQIYNHTFSDKRTLNIDIEEFFHNYDYAIKKILDHIQLYTKSLDSEYLSEKLKLYDIQSSFIYRLNLKFNQYSDTEHTNFDDMISSLKKDDDIIFLYSEILALFDLKF